MCILNFEPILPKGRYLVTKQGSVARSSRSKSATPGGRRQEHKSMLKQSHSSYSTCGDMLNWNYVGPNYSTTRVGFELALRIGWVKISKRCSDLAIVVADVVRAVSTNRSDRPEPPLFRFSRTSLFHSLRAADEIGSIGEGHPRRSIDRRYTLRQYRRFYVHRSLR